MLDVMPCSNVPIMINRANIEIFVSKEGAYFMDKKEIYSLVSFVVKVILLPLLVAIMINKYSTGSSGIASPASMAAGIVEFLAGVIVGYLIWAVILLLEMAIIRRRSLVVTNLSMMIFALVFTILWLIRP